VLRQSDAETKFRVKHDSSNMHFQYLIC